MSLTVTLTEQQRAAAHAAGSVAVLAGAGTGKTFLLAHRYLHHLQQGLSPLEIVAMTFTNEAADELRSRMRQAVHNAYPTDRKLQAEFEVGVISTIHALCTRLCQEQPELAGLPVGFRVMDEIQAALWFDEHFRQQVAQLPAQLFEHVPFSQMVQVLRALFKDPWTAEDSLQVSAAKRRAALEADRAEALATLLANSEFQQALAVVKKLEGTPGDLMADQRRPVLDACEQLLACTAHDDPGLALEALDGINLRGGRAAAWGGKENVDSFKAALRALREITRQLQKTSLLGWSWGEVDEQLEAALPDIAEAFRQVQVGLKAVKQRDRLATFSDLELGALCVLKNDAVHAEYAGRWRAVMVDEFQDTNPVQIKLLDRLTDEPEGAPPATLTTVGDAKQSIYGFRRASPELSQAMAQAIGNTVELSTSFRTHGGLLRQLDTLFAPLLADAHQPLDAQRAEPAGQGPWLQVRTIVNEKDGPAKGLLERAEARLIARDLRRMLDEKTPVWDKRERAYRPLRPADVAVLGRSWSVLPVIADALAEAGIPAVLTGGQDLLATREAQDGLLLLQFLADPVDDIALVGLLRSPFLALNDRLLMQIALDRDKGEPWWQLLKRAEAPEALRAWQLLAGLLQQARELKPVRLLRLADRHTGYTAVLSGLPGSERRLADWQGFVEFIAEQEQAGASLFAIVRQLRALQRLSLEVQRPALASTDSVSLMTVHASKGLEWPVVFLPDLSRRTGGGWGRQQALFDAELGCAVLFDDEGEAVRPGLYTLLAARENARDEAEANRVLYVACTRAADRLVLSSISGNSGLWKPLSAAFAAAGLEPEEVESKEADHAVFSSVAALPGAAAATRLTDTVQQPLTSLPVTALPVYAACPKRFRYQFLDRHPGVQHNRGDGESGRETDGAGNDGSEAARIGTLTHKALELGLDSTVDLARFDLQLDEASVQEALELARRFRTDDAFSSVHAQLGSSVTLEQPVQHDLSGIRLQGVIDVVHPEFVLDYKTDREVEPGRHALQLAVYAQATGVQAASIAYLRSGEIHHFGSSELEQAYLAAGQAVEGINLGRFKATPSLEACRSCPYREICSDAIKD